MAKAKGYHGETCAKALRNSILQGEIVTYTELFARVREKGEWRDGTINQHMMSCVVNLPPARYHWKRRKPFLFIHSDGRYEAYRASIHPEVIE